MSENPQSDAHMVLAEVMESERYLNKVTTKPNTTIH